MTELFSANVLYLNVTEDYTNWAGFKITFKEAIDVQLLQDVVRRSFRRYPYFSEKVVFDGNKYVLVTNDKPFVVYTDKDGPLDILGPGNNYYQIRMTVSDNILDARFFHGLTDGRGFSKFIKSVLYEYFSILNADAPDVPGVVLLDSKITDDELGDPFLNRDVPAQQDREQDNKAQKNQKDAKLFRLPLTEQADGNTYSFQIRMDEQQFMKYSRNVDGSPNAVIALLMARAILSEHPEASDEIVAGVAMDERTALERPESHLSSITLILLRYKKKMETMPLTTQATCFRGMIIAGSDPDKVRSGFPKSIGFYNMLNSIPSFADRKKLASMIVSARANEDTFHVSYIERSCFGELEQYIESLYSIVEVKGNSMMIEINSLKGSFFINIMQGFSSDRYVRAMIRQIEQEGMSCTIDKSEVLAPMSNDLVML